MDKRKNIRKSVWVKIILVVVLLLLAFLIRSTLEQKEEKKQTKTEKKERDVNYAPAVEKDNSILLVFKELYPQAEVILACEEDVTNDGNKDLIVIYRQDTLTRTVVLSDSGDHTTYHSSEPIPAPVENQKIQFKNIDKEAEIEIIITGEKAGAVGYAIYRMIHGEPVDLFGEGMEDCC